MRTFTTSDFDFALPPELIAQHPAAERSGSRLLDGSGAAPVDRIFRDLPTLLQPGDLLVFNDTQVVKARLFGEKATGGKLELLIERVLPDGTVAAHMKVSKKPLPGSRLHLAGGVVAELLGRWPNADGPLFHLRFSHDAYAVMAAHGHVPLPPYIAHGDTTEDAARYQTVFAKNPGAVAAPTAALHFDDGVLAALDARGVQRAAVTLHVGAGTVLRMAGGFTAELLGRWPDAHGPLFHLRFSADPYALMAAHGHVPLPPYITHGDTAEDATRYQTVFAKNPGAVAAPTAALHFDEALLAALQTRGVQRAAVTLHVGAGTFQPVKTERLDEHVMHRERYHVPPETAQAIADCRARGGRVVAVGTTSVRTLESWAASGDASGDTGIFITPGFRFKVVDGLITNFHLPRSTLMMLVSAFAGHAHVMALYRHAFAQRYRFFSYGDAMLLARASGDDL